MLVQDAHPGLTPGQGARLTPGQEREADSRSGREAGPWSGREALDDPAAILAAVPQPVVQAVGPALPELDDVGDQPVAAPEVRHGHLGALRPPALQLREAFRQD